MKNYRLGLYEKAIPNRYSLSEKLSIAKRLGFDYLEISIDETDAKLQRLKSSSEELAELVRAQFENDFFIESMCLSAHRKYPMGSHDADVRKRSMEIMKDAIVFAHHLGIRIIQLAGYDVYYEESDELTKKYFLENLRIAVSEAARYGVVLAFETMETPFMNTVGKAMAYVSEINSPYLGVYPDTGNVTNSGCSVVGEIALGAGHIFAAHLKETLPGIFREVEFSKGHVDFAAAIKAYRAIGCNRFLAEMWDTGREDWQEKIADANRFLRAFLDGEF